MDGHWTDMLLKYITTDHSLRHTQQNATASKSVTVRDVYQSYTHTINLYTYKVIHSGSLHFRTSEYTLVDITIYILGSHTLYMFSGSQSSAHV